ncbi:DNA/RNA polymerase, partial [Polyplosphaeria fusca]
SVFEHENPALKSLPLAVQQKQIVVTCNYEARRRGLYKLQLVKEARQICPDVVIVLGEDLTRFRDASKHLYAFLRAFSWNDKVERLGFDEVFMDVSDLISYNVGLLNPNHLPHSFFCLSKNDPAAGFAFDASSDAGTVYPHPDQASNKIPLGAPDSDFDALRLRLRLGSHLAEYLRHQLETEKGYTCTVGISTSKLLAKLVGNVHKPNGQTTLLPPYFSDVEDDNVTSFIGGHEIGKIPGIGFKLAQKLRSHVLQRAPDFDTGLVYGGTKENVTVATVRNHPGVDCETLEQILGGPGSPHGIGSKVWGLLHGSDDTEVGQARDVPTQISIEDSYTRLHTLEEVLKELRILSKSLLKRMHADLLEDDEQMNGPDDPHTDNDSLSSVRRKRWMAYPKTLRLSTRPRPPQNPDGSRNRSFARISRSVPMPSFIFNLKESIEVLTDRLVAEVLLPLFKRLHPEKSGWNLSLVNLAATNMIDAASEKGGVGRDISKMFKRQDEILKPFKGRDISEQPLRLRSTDRHGSEDVPTPSQEYTEDMEWQSDDEDAVADDSFQCEECGSVMPMFALAAHSRWHAQG